MRERVFASTPRHATSSSFIETAAAATTMDLSAVADLHDIDYVIAPSSVLESRDVRRSRERVSSIPS